MATKTFSDGGTLTTTSITQLNSYRTNSEFANKTAFAAIKSDGSVVGWGGNYTFPTTLDGSVDVKQIYSNENAFAAVHIDGSVTTWGAISSGGEKSTTTVEQLNGKSKDVVQIYSTSTAFAALREDGSVVTWGGTNSGGDSTTVSAKLDSNVKQIYSTTDAFAAIRADNSVVTWGGANAGGDSSFVNDKLNDVAHPIKQIYTNDYAFATIRNDGSVVAWGDANAGGTMSAAVAARLDGSVAAVKIVANGSAFAALRVDNSILAWGDPSVGGDSSTVVKLDEKTPVKDIIPNSNGFAVLRTDGTVVSWGDGEANFVTNSSLTIDQVYATSGAFAGVRSDGSVVAWGNNGLGGNTDTVSRQLDGTIDVSKIYSNGSAFAALRADGSVVTWGGVGGDSSLVATQLDGTIDKVDVTQIYVNPNAFAALRADGSVLTWGNKDKGGDSSLVSKDLDGTIDVVQIYSTPDAFSALRADGSVITWGNSNTGGDSSKAKDKLTAGVVSFADVSTDDIYSAPNSPPAGSVTISGTAQQEQTLTAANTLTDTDGLGEISYQWLNEGAAISGATTSTYRLTQADVGKEISVKASYIDGLSILQQMTSSGVVATNTNDVPTGTVTITGTARETLTLTATNTLADADGLGTISYQWLSDGSVITGATASDYKLTPAEVAKAISVKASYIDLQNTPESVTSLPTEKVTTFDKPHTGTIVIQGKAIQGETLSIQNDLKDDDGLGVFSYQWLQNGKSISGATQATYKLLDSDIGTAIKVVVSYIDGLGFPESETSAATALVDISPASALKVPAYALTVDKNIANEGDTIAFKLTTVNVATGIEVPFAFSGSISDKDVLGGLKTTSFFVETDGTATLPIKFLADTITDGADENLIMTLTTDKTKFVDVLVKDTSLIDSVVDIPVIATPIVTPPIITPSVDPSAPLVTTPEPVFSNHLPTGIVTITGTLKQDQILTATNTLTDADGLGTISYQWLSDGVAIPSGATSAAYVLTASDVGKVISVKASYTDLRKTAESVMSSPTDKIAAIDVKTSDLITLKPSTDGLLSTIPTTKEDHNETANSYGFAAIKVDGSVVAWGQNSYVPASLAGTTTYAVQIYSNASNFVVLRNDGALIPLGYQNIDAVTLQKLNGTVDVTSVFSTNTAFAAIRTDGSVITWGDKTAGGDSKVVAAQIDGTIPVTKISSNAAAFAAIRNDGSVVTWGNNNYGADSSAVVLQLNGTIDVTQIFAKDNAFAALRTDGSLITWGSGYGADSSSVSAQLDGTIDVKQVYSYGFGFAALRADDSLVSWGGDSVLESKDVTQVSSNVSSLAALHKDGSVTSSWGSAAPFFSADIAKQLDGTIDVTKIYSNDFAFAALRADGSVVTWGDNTFGGNSSSVVKELDGSIDATDVKEIHASANAFAALRADGSVVTWGAIDSTEVADKIDGTIDVKQIYSNDDAFAAVLENGSVVTWGNASHGGDSRSVASKLDGSIDVKQIYSTPYAFSAIRADGSVVTWGQSFSGGDSSAVANKLTSGVASFATTATTADFVPSVVMSATIVKNTLPTGSLSIGGSATENETLTVTNKIADADGLGKMNYQWLSDGTAITGANQPSYTLSQMDVGKKISVAANYTDKLGTIESVVSSSTAFVSNMNDAPKGSVIISGVMAKGQTLTASNTLRDEDGLGAINYQWLSNGKAISSATNATYILSDADVAKKISVKANYTDLQRTSESITSPETSVITASLNHAPTGSVLINGIFKQKETLTASNTLDDADGLGTISYQWLSNGEPIKNATKETYKLTQADVRKTLSVTASYTDKLGNVEKVSGGFVQDENDKPVGGVIIDGVTQIGETLQAKNGIYDEDGLVSDGFSYQWRADGVAIAGVNGDTMILTNEQLGKTISVVAQYTDMSGNAESLTSKESSKVLLQNTLPTGYVMIMGEAKTGVELSVLSSLADVNGLGEFSYQWLRSGTPIKGAVSDTYKLVLSDAGEKISVNVEYVDGFNSFESITSTSTATVQAIGNVLDGATMGKIVGTTKNDVLSASPKIDTSITGLVGNDVLIGNTGNDALDGGAGNDKILGGSGKDTLSGGVGNDTLKGGTGIDSMAGGDGNDYYYIDDTKDVVTESNKNVKLGGVDTIEATFTVTLDAKFENVENIVLAGDKNLNGTGNAFSNQILGNAGNNLLNGLDENDELFGDKGMDTLLGGNGEDILNGGEGDDVIYGDAGNDVLYGGEGSDMLDGGDGEDTAVFNNAQTDYQIISSTTAEGAVQLIIKYIGNSIDEGVDMLSNIEMLKFDDNEAINVIDLVGVATDSTATV